MRQFVVGLNQFQKTMETAEAVCHRLQGINHLPPELLSYICVLCTHQPDEEVFDRYIQVLAPTVCRHWRKVALATPALWTNIQIVKPVPCKRTVLYLKRAGSTVPLDVEIRIATLDDPEKGRNPEELSTYVERTWRTLEFILKHGGSSSRWRSLELSTNVFACYSILISFLSKVSLSSLESMKFVFSGPSPEHAADIKMFFNSYRTRKSSRLLFVNPPPKLRSVVLEGIMSRHLFSDISQPQLVGLSDMNISIEAWHPGINHIHSVLAACSRLTTLKFNSEQVDPAEDLDTEFTKTSPSSRITLSSLRSLSLMHMRNPAWNLAVIQIFKAPAIHCLELSFWADADASQPLVDHISNQLAQSTPYFPVTLSKVSFFTAMGETANIEPLLRAYSNITSLRTASPTALLRRPWLVPNLANLEIVTQDASELKNLVLGRCRDGLPLKTVQVRWLGEDSSLSKDDKEQIGSMVYLTVSVEEALEDDDEDNDSQDEIEWWSLCSKIIYVKLSAFN